MCGGRGGGQWRVDFLERKYRNFTRLNNAFRFLTRSLAGVTSSGEWWLGLWDEEGGAADDEDWRSLNESLGTQEERMKGEDVVKVVWKY